MTRPNGAAGEAWPATAQRTGTSGKTDGNSVSRSVKQMTQAGVIPFCAIQSKTQT
jgi:hypothetical protein